MRWVELAKERSNPVGTCWLWQGAIDKQGYARVRNRRRTDRLHHLICKEIHAPSGRWVARHLCGCRACVNPAHIAPGTQRQNYDDDRQHARLAIELLPIKQIEKIAALCRTLVGDAAEQELSRMSDIEIRKADRRTRLVIDQTTRGGSSVLDRWWADMLAAMNRKSGSLQNIGDDDVLLLAVMARSKRREQGKPEPINNGLATDTISREPAFRTRRPNRKPGWAAFGYN